MRLHHKQQLDRYLGNFLVAISLVAAKTLGFLLRRNHSLRPPPRNIIFIKIMGIGSVLMAADGILAIKEKYPGARLILLGSSAVINGIRPTGLFDEYWVYKDHSLFNVAGSAIRSIFRSWRRKRRWVCNFEVYSKLTTVFSLWTCARNRFDFFFNEVSFRKNINTHPVYFNQFSLAYENYDRMARALGAEIRTRFEFPSFPASGRVNTGKKYIVISNTCSELSRERLYPQGLLATLCIELYSLCHCPILLSGTKTDFEQYENTLKDKRLAGLPVQNIAGKYSVEEFLSVLYHECRLLVTVDSAPLHFAYRLGVPTVSLWGPTNPATRMRETALFRPVYLSAPCSPCAHYTTVLPCGGDNFCMKNMSVAMVLQKVEEVMNNIV